MPFSLTSHHAHDYKYLVQRWRALARSAGLRMKSFAVENGYAIYAISSPEKRNDDRETIYISAGVHGDEPAPPWGLLAWAEAHVALLQSHRFLILPTLNPHGLVQNTRVDHRGVDINRTFDHAENPLMAAWRNLLTDRKLSIALCLHEDYDALGCYIYELTRQSASVSKGILSDCEHLIPIDRRGKIDGRAAKDGVIMRRVPPKLAGYPEAIVLHWLGAPVTLTFESPSEFALLERVAVQKAFIQSALKHVLELPSC
ncbi:M14 family metallocarboxypeptidase [soil metagenome]